MAITGVITFIVVLLGLALIGSIFFVAANSVRGRPTRLGITLAVILLIAILVLMPLNAGLVLVQPNEIGVVFHQTSQGANTLGQPLQPGLQWVVPFVDKVYLYDVGQQSVDMLGIPSSLNAQETTGQGWRGQPAVRAITKDGQQIFMDITVIFQIDPTQVNKIHRSWPSTLDNPAYIIGYVIPQTRSAVRNAVSDYSAEEIYSGGRGALEAQITDSLKTALETQGFRLTDILIRDISFSQQFTEAIEQKQIAQQQAQQAAFRVQQAQQEAEQARVVAQGQADSAVIAAKGDAEATVLRAQAEAEALKLVSEVIGQNPLLVQYRYIEQLADNVQLVIIPSNSPFLFNLQDLLNQSGGGLPSVPAAPPTSPTSVQPTQQP